MNNPRLTAKDRGMIKGACRRAFARSSLHQSVVNDTMVDHYDHNRPRVRKWSRCAKCKGLTPRYLIQVDHIVPLVALDSSLAQMSWDEVIDRLWCPKENLWGICTDCHDAKSADERKLRMINKKGKK